MNKVPGNEILQEILNGNDKVLEQVYRSVYAFMVKYAKPFGASDSNIAESVQNAFEVFYRQALTKNLLLTCTVETYVIAIAKRNFLKAAKSETELELKADKEPESIDDFSAESKYEEDMLYENRAALFWKEFKNLGKDCQKVLKMTLAEKSVKEIMLSMNYNSEEYTRTKRKRCKKYLIGKIKENPAYEKLRNDDREDDGIPFGRNESNRKTKLQKRVNRG